MDSSLKKIHKTLESIGASVDEVSLIRDRDTGKQNTSFFFRLNF